jgi:WD40 repeat protein
VPGGREIRKIDEAEAAVYSVAFDAAGSRLAAAGQDKKIRIYDAQTGALQATLEGHPDFVYRASFNGRGDRLLSCGYGGTLIVWNLADGKPLWQTRIDRVANSAAWSPSGESIVVSGGDGDALVITVPIEAR